MGQFEPLQKIGPTKEIIYLIMLIFIIWFMIMLNKNITCGYFIVVLLLVYLLFLYSKYS